MWSRAETFIIYVFLLLYLLAPMVASYFSLQPVRDAVPVLAAVVLLLVFRRLDVRIDSLGKPDLTPVKGIDPAVREILSGHQRNTVDILASSGLMYHLAFKYCNATAKHVRLLVRSSDQLGNMGLPVSGSDKARFKDHIADTVKNWIELERIGAIGSLTIRTYAFDSTCHFMLVDDKILQFGLFQPTAGFPGTDVRHSFTVYGKSAGGASLLEDARQMFTAIWGSEQLSTQSYPEQARLGKELTDQSSAAASPDGVQPEYK